MDIYKVWEIISYAWTEIGIEDAECKSLVNEGKIRQAHLAEVDKLFFRDICASFAVDSFLAVPLMLWVLMPDWGYSEEYLRKRMTRWYERPYWTHYLNPLRILGYPLAVLFAWRYRSMLRRAVHSDAGV